MWLSKDPIGLSGGLNLYAFCGGDAVNSEDGLGLSRVIITDVAGRTKKLHNPSLSDFRGVIQSYGDHSIVDLTIYDHGWVNMMSIDGEGNGFSIGANGRVCFDDGDSSVADVIGPKLVSGANILLSGCFTAYEGMFNPSGNNIAKALSVELPNIKVSGNRRFSIGNKFGPTWNIGIRRTYVNGKER
jgi:hypothetical protein